jgi:hypothetical protein
MALPRHELFDPAGKLIGVYETRADAEHAIERDIQARSSGYTISDEKFRAQEAAEQFEFYTAVAVEEAKEKLTAEAARQAMVKEAKATLKAEAERQAAAEAELAKK